MSIGVHVVPVISTMAVVPRILRISLVGGASFAQNSQEKYGINVWPCAVAFSEYVWQQRSCFLHRSVIELGGDF